MGMTIDEAIKHLERILVNEKENQFYAFSTTSISVALDAMRKYQRIQAIVKEWREVGLDYDSCDAMDNIERVIENGSDKRL